MLSFLRLKQPPATDLLTSKLYNENTFYTTFKRDLKHCKSEAIIESPYMTMTRVLQLRPVLKKLVKRGVKVTVNTRFPSHHDEHLRIQGWLSAKALKQIGVKVYFFSDYHHRKIAILDGRILWEGSLNILSQCYSREIMRRIESEDLSKQMTQFLRLKRFYW